ncbi:MAG: hypothetical protein NTW14_14475 [bacterium]|nr:hypothetical protein [bacterium]
MRSTSARMGFTLIALLILSSLWLQGCGDPPATAVLQYGSIRVEALLPDSTLADSVEIALDDVNLGTYDNPYTLNNVLAGSHLLAMSHTDSIAPDSSIEYQNSDTLTVSSGQVSAASWTLIAEGPYPGNPAPQFSVYDLDSNLVSLAGSAGKIVLLYFFEST